MQLLSEINVDPNNVKIEETTQTALIYPQPSICQLYFLMKHLDNINAK